jgi:GTP-binding protein
MLFDGLARIDVDEAGAGEIVAVAGIPKMSIGETIADIENPEALPIIHIDEPTVKMTFGVNTSPLMGKEGKFTTTRNLRERLEKEIETDVALLISPSEKEGKWTVAGRGELHLSILIEKMRREGFELEVSRPQVIFKEENGQKTEPMELLSVEVPEEFSGTVIEMLGKRLGVMKDMKVDRNMAYLDFSVPTRGIIGLRNQFLTSTKGQGIMNSIFTGYEPYKGESEHNEHGSLVASEAGASNSYGLINAQGRGELFITPGVPVYKGMVVGQNAKALDIPVNICKTKELTNFRSKNMGVQEHLEVPKEMSLEDALEYIGDDELVEITPKSIRIRKMFLTDADRKRAGK